MPLRFRGVELRPVLAEAIRERCPIVLKRGDGVYWHAACSPPYSRGYLTPIAYALGCNPRVNAFEHWWDRACDTLGHRPPLQGVRPQGCRICVHPVWQFRSGAVGGAQPAVGTSCPGRHAVSPLSFRCSLAPAMRGGFFFAQCGHAAARVLARGSRRNAGRSAHACRHKSATCQATFGHRGCAQPPGCVTEPVRIASIARTATGFRWRCIRLFNPSRGYAPLPARWGRCVSASSYGAPP